MQLLKLAFLGLRQSLRQNLLFVLQLAAVFAVVNLLIAGLNNQTMRIVPYEEFLEKGGYYCSTYVAIDAPEERDKYEPQAILDILQGDLDATVMYSGTVIWEQKEINCIICDDALMEKMQLPLVAGTQLGTKQAALVSPNAYGISAGDVLKASALGVPVTISVAGELTDPTYQPHWNQWFIDADISLFYKKFELTSSDLPFLVMSESTSRAIGLQAYCFTQTGILFTYRTPPTEELYETNAEALESFGMVTTSEEIQARTEQSLTAAYQKFIPLGILVFLVALVGFVFHIALQTLSQTRTYVIYYLCGMQWQKIAALNAIMLLVLLGSALLLCGDLIWLSVRTVISAQFGLLYQWNNLLITALMCAACFAVSVLVPCIMLFRRSPADLLRRK